MNASTASTTPAPTHMIVDMDGDIYSRGSLERCRAAVDKWEDEDPRTVAGVGIRVVSVAARWVRPDMRYGGEWKADQA